MPRFYTGLAAVAFGGLLAACSPATPDWKAPGVGVAETEADWADCRRLADARVGPRRGAIDGSVSADPTGRAGGDPLETYDRQKAEKVFRATVTACMRGKGYYPAEVE